MIKDRHKNLTNLKLAITSQFRTCRPQNAEQWQVMKGNWTIMVQVTKLRVPSFRRRPFPPESFPSSLVLFVSKIPVVQIDIPARSRPRLRQLADLLCQHILQGARRSSRVWKATIVSRSFAVFRIRFRCNLFRQVINLFLSQHVLPRRSGRVSYNNHSQSNILNLTDDISGWLCLVEFYSSYSVLFFSKYSFSGCWPRDSGYFISLTRPLHVKFYSVEFSAHVLAWL